MGETLLFNVYAGAEALQDFKLMELILKRVPEVLELRPLKHTLQLYHFPCILPDGRGSGDFGISGNIILLESHCALHTWPEKGYMRLEVSSCKKLGDLALNKVFRTVQAIMGQKTTVTGERVSWKQG